MSCAFFNYFKVSSNKLQAAQIGLNCLNKVYKCFETFSAFSTYLKCNIFHCKTNTNKNDIEGDYNKNVDVQLHHCQTAIILYTIKILINARAFILVIMHLEKRGGHLLEAVSDHIAGSWKTQAFPSNVEWQYNIVTIFKLGYSQIEYAFEGCIFRKFS